MCMYSGMHQANPATPTKHVLVRTAAQCASQLLSQQVLYQRASAALVNGNPMQAKAALQHPYFDDLDKEAVDALENQQIQAYYP